jgi:hypothetical protein
VSTSAAAMTEIVLILVKPLLNSLVPVGPVTLRSQRSVTTV